MLPYLPEIIMCHGRLDPARILRNISGHQKHLLSTHVQPSSENTSIIVSCLHGDKDTHIETIVLYI